jgi:uncharacterized RmlC-like cupin family protein
MFFTAPGDFKKRELSPRVDTRLVWGEKLMLSYVTIQPKVGLTIGPETREIKKGDMFLVPPGTPHGLASTFDQPAVILDIFSPPREEFKK